MFILDGLGGSSAADHAYDEEQDDCAPDRNQDTGKVEAGDALRREVRRGVEPQPVDTDGQRVRQTGDPAVVVGGGAAYALLKPRELDPAASLEQAGVAQGVTEEVRGRLFEPYTSTKEGGTGLGLTIVNQIVSDHGGTVRYADRKPHGSIFTLELPLR